MKSLFTLLLVLSAVVTCNATSKGGWAKTRWGMTVEQVALLYPTAVPSDKQMKDMKFGPEKVPKLHIGSYSIDGSSYEVEFFFDSTGGLSEIFAGRQCNDEKESATAGRKLTEHLTLKYGAPKPGKQDSEKYWMTLETVVHLTYTTSPAIRGLSMVTIEYYNPTSTTLDRL